MREALRILRSAVWLTCVIACVACSALWIRSHLWHDALYRHVVGTSWQLTSYRGLVTYSRSTSASEEQDRPTHLNSKRASDYEQQLADLLARIQRMDKSARRDDLPTTLGFGWEQQSSPYLDHSPNNRYSVFPSRRRVGVPYYFVVALTAAIALLAKPKPRLSFSLRDALVVMTLVGVGVATLVAVLRDVVVE